MKHIEQYIPLVVTVGQVVIFPYYIIWLRSVSFDYTLFAWMFAVFSFAAAWGYRVFQSKRNFLFFPLLYIGMGFVYIIVGSLTSSSEYLPYLALFLQVTLGFLQGYWRAWHVDQKNYRIHAADHYIIVGFTMLVLSFMTVLSPSIFLTAFGVLLCLCGVWEMFHTKKKKD